MFRTTLAAIAIAALALPAVAQANTTPAELRHDVRVVHKQKHQLAHAKAHHNKHRVNKERRDLRVAKKELRKDARDYKRTQTHS